MSEKKRDKTSAHTIWEIPDELWPIIVEADGGPLGAAIAGANVHDTKLLADTLEAVVVARPQPTEETPQHLCQDTGDDNPTGPGTVAA